MGRRGPKPQSAGVKSQRAAVRSRSRKTVAAEASQPTSTAAGSSNAPPWLKGEGLKIFQRMAPMLRSMKLLTDADVPAFSRYCVHYARWLDLQSRLKKGSDIYAIKTASGKVLRPHPAFMMATKLDALMLSFEDRFGLNPAERQRIFMSRATGSSADLFAPLPAAEKRPDDAAAKPVQPTEPEQGPVGFLN